MRRRSFLAAAPLAAAGCGRGGAFRTLLDSEARTLDALLAHIIPSDDAPGAREAGVVHFIDRQLTGHYREHRIRYSDGLGALDRLAGGNFADAAPDRQAQAVQLFERGPDRTFFELVVTHAMQGFYGNPRHGGNRDFASWRMLGVPPVPIRGRNRYDPTGGGGDAKG